MLVRQKRHVERAAFTLMEIIVVVAIILILAGAGIVMYQNMLINARIDRAKMDVKNIEQVVQTIQVRTGVFPETLRELTQLGPNGEPALLTEAALKDPWGQEYFYEPQNLHPLTLRPKIYTNGEPGKGRPIDNWGDATQ